MRLLDGCHHGFAILAKRHLERQRDTRGMNIPDSTKGCHTDPIAAHLLYFEQGAGARRAPISAPGVQLIFDGSNGHTADGLIDLQSRILSPRKCVYWFNWLLRH